MGCGLTKGMNAMDLRKRRDTAPMSVDDLKHSLLDEYTHVQKRFGHPHYYKKDGFSLGVRVNGYERYHSFYVGTSRADTKELVFIKEHHMNLCTEADVIREVLILAKLSHPCLPELQELFITDASVFTVSKPLESTRLSTLYDFRPNSRNQLSFHDTRCIIKSVMEAVHFCHSKQILVRNLTAKNICVKRLLTNTSGSSGSGSQFEVKIADFSLAVTNGCSEYLCDSPYFSWSQVPFMSPEALLGNPYSYPMDMWAVGVLLFMMVTNTLPFQHDDDVELMHRITNSIYTYPGSSVEDCNPIPAPIRYLISQLLFVDTGMRLSDSEALNNVWLNSPALPEECVVWNDQQ